MANFKFEKDGVNVIGLQLTPADFINGKWHSDIKTIQNVDRMTVNATYAALTPDRADNIEVDYRLKVVLEGRILDDANNEVWTPLVNQFTPMFSSESALTRRLIATSRPTSYDPDREHIIADALGNAVVEVSVEDVDIPDAVRVCIELADTNSGNAGLTSFEITLNGQAV